MTPVRLRALLVRPALRAWLDRSLANRMALAAGLLAGALVLVLGAASYALVRDTMAEAARSELQAEGRLIADRLAGTFRTAREDVEGLAATTLVANALVDSTGRDTYLQPFLREESVPIAVPYRFGLANHTGLVVASKTGESGFFGERPWWPALVERAEPAAEVTAGDDPTLVMAFPVIYRATGTAEGALILEVPLRPLLQLAADPFRDQGHRVLFYAGARLLQSLAPPGYVFAEGDLRERVPVLYAGRGPKPDLAVVVETPRGLALDGLARLRWPFLGGGLAALLLAGLLARAAAARVVAPLQALSRAAEAARDPAAPPVRFELEGADERAELARSLQAMLDGLRTSRELLELRVAERTAALGFAESRLRAILDHMLDGLVTIGETGTIQSFNRSAERLFGWKAEEVVGRNVSCLMLAGDGAAHDGHLRRYVETGQAKVVGAGRIVEGVRKDGSTFPLELAVSDVRASGHRLFVGLVRDVTERLRVERQKSEFVSTVSHELRTPLTAIHGALGLLAGGAAGPLPDPAGQLVRLAAENGERLRRLIDDLLDMQKIEAGKLSIEPVAAAAAALVEKAIELNQPFAARLGVRLEASGGAPAGEVWVDPLRFQQIMANLLSNACKFTPAGGVVSLSAAPGRAGLVRFEVADQGPGVPVGFRDRLFKKFAQADSSSSRAGSGTGLGLAITKALVERMGGEIGYRSEEGRGAVFHVELPLVPAPRPEAT